MNTLISNFQMLVSLSLMSLLLGACSTIPTTNELEQMSKLIELEKGPCYGDCAIYTLTIFSNGVLQFKGEENTEKQGLFIKKIAQNDLRKLVKAFRDADFFGFQEAYRSNIPDQQTVTISFTDGGQTKIVAGKANRPESLLELQSMLEELANSKEWKLKPGSEESTVAFSEIIVSLVKGVNTEDWLDKYKPQNVQLKDALSPTGNYILITFNQEIIKAEELLELIRQDPDVIGAEFNQEVFNR